MEQPSLDDRQPRDRIQETLAPRLISEPLQSKVAADLLDRTLTSLAPDPTPAKTYEVIIELNLKNAAGRLNVRWHLLRMLEQMLGGPGSPALSRNRSDSTHPYLFATMSAAQIRELIEQDSRKPAPITREDPTAQAAAEQQVAVSPATPPRGDQAVSSSRHDVQRSIFRIWESQKVHPLTTESIRTVKANAAHSSFGAVGEDIVWAVMDSGIDATHPHFTLHDNLVLPAPLSGRSTSFVPAVAWDHDAYGHGTHVAGIIAGECAPGSTPQAALQSAEEGTAGYRLAPLTSVKGMAPKAKLLILRVLDDNGDGDETALIQAIEYVQQLNDYGRHLVVHGVNISAGFPAHPTWYACGQTPLCVEINRLVKSGVAVVVAAGNSGHIVTILNMATMNTSEAGQVLSINDPGNADLAITVGSTHRQSPHTFGISYFSSKGPTSDGRRKPEVVAPGEKIISCASADRVANASLFPASSTPGSSAAPVFQYIEDSGTSMAAPHVSGVLAAFLSVKREFLGQPEVVKSLLMQSAVDLNRDPAFQGAGMVDLMKLIQSV